MTDLVSDLTQRLDRSSKSITSSNDTNSSVILGFTSTSNITSEINSRIFSNGSLIFGIDGNSQKLITSNDTRLTIAIADLIISEGIPFNTAQKPRFKKVLELSRNISKTCIPPNRKLISKELLDVIHEHNMKRNLAMIKNEAEIFGLSFLGDGGTISRFTLLNMLYSAKNIPVAVLKIVDCWGHLADRNKKYETNICNHFLNHMREIDPKKTFTDIVMFGGSLNVQLGGKLLKVHYPKLTVMRGFEHTVLLFFNAPDQ